MNENFKKELSCFLDYLEDKVDESFKEEVETAIEEFKKEYGL